MMRGVIVSTMLAPVVGKQVVLATFDEVEETTLPFATVNDPVMGGQSTSTFSTSKGVGVFEGEVAVVPFLGSPGFCNLEAPGFNAPAIEFPDISGTDGITVVGRQTVTGGLTNWNVALRTEALKQMMAAPDAAWQADIENFAHSDEHFVPYSAFKCNFRGRPLDNCGDLAEQLAGVQSVAVGSSGVAGSFRLELSSIAATDTPSSLQTKSDVVPLATFLEEDDAFRSWIQQNDPVMGGASRGTFEVVNGVGVMNGTVALIPSLGAPGFIKVTTIDTKPFADVSACSGLALTTKSSSNPAQYGGYRVSFGTDSAFLQCGKFFARGFKADFTAGEGEISTVQVPFNRFTKCWDDSTGDAIHTCEEDSRFCPSSSRLANLQTISIWAEGAAADLTLTIESIAAYGCTTTIAV